MKSNMARVVRSVVSYKNLGRINYRDGLAAMKKLTQQHTKWTETEPNSREPTPNTLIICEHFPVYTTGIRDKNVKDIEYLEKLGAEFQYTDRGGLITFHGPGQIMCYPILDLRHFTKSVRCYNEMLEEVGIRTCRKFGVVAKRTGDPGVWVDDTKIAAIGFHVSRWITTHGLALNCNVDLGWFDHIVPCGLVGKGVTSLSVETWKNISVEKATAPFLQSFQEVFNCELRQNHSNNGTRVKVKTAYK